MASAIVAQRHRRDQSSRTFGGDSNWSGEVLLVDGFESGDLSGWSVVVD